MILSQLICESLEAGILALAWVPRVHGLARRICVPCDRNYCHVGSVVRRGVCSACIKEHPGAPISTGRRRGLYCASGGNAPIPHRRMTANDGRPYGPTAPP